MIPVDIPAKSVVEFGEPKGRSVRLDALTSFAQRRPCRTRAL